MMNGDSAARYPALPGQSPVRTIGEETKRDETRAKRGEGRREEKKKGNWKGMRGEERRKGDQEGQRRRKVKGRKRKTVEDMRGRKEKREKGG